MSLTLDVYAVSWTDLAEPIGSRSRVLFGRILKKTEPYFDEVFEADDFDDGPDFERGLERWVEGDLRPAGGDTEPHRIVNLGDALGFVALTRFYGRRLGTLNHSSAAGDLFREDFLLGAAQRLLQPSYSLECLVSRPILGYESDDFPFWGGLSRAELRELEAVLRQDAPTWDADPEIDRWLLELWNVLRAGAEAKTDLVSIYS